jgi:hypothetical protein
MTSVITSARRSTASVFDFVGSIATASNQLIAVGAYSIDALDAKAALMRDRVVLNAKAQRVTVMDDEILKAASEHTTIMEEAHRRHFPDVPFDKAAHFKAAVEKITAALEEK